MYAALATTPGSTLAECFGFDTRSRIDDVERAAGVPGGIVRAMIHGEMLPTMDDAAELVALSRAAGVGLLTYRATMHRDSSQAPAAEGAAGPLRFVMSTVDADRYRDIVAQDFSLDGFRQNPVAPWAHDYSIPPVGRWVDVGIVDGALLGSLVFDEAPDNALGRLVASQYRAGFLSAVSVGFLPGSVTPRAQLPETDPAHDRSGFVFRENSLLECSPVVVPGNALALLVGRSPCAPATAGASDGGAPLFAPPPVTVEPLEWLDAEDYSARALPWLG